MRSCSPHAHAAVINGNSAALWEAADYAGAMAAGAERYRELNAQGKAFSEITLATWGSPTLVEFCAAYPRAVPFPVAVGVAAGDHHIALSSALHAYVHAFTANLVSAAVRLVPLGHTDGQRALMRLESLRRRSGRAGRDRRPLAALQHRHPRRHGIHAARNPAYEAVPLMRDSDTAVLTRPGTDRKRSSGPLRVGIGGPVGSGKTALMEALCTVFRDRYDMCAITNDIYTKEDAAILMRAGALPDSRIMGVETGRLPPHRHSRRRLDQPRCRGGDARPFSEARSHPDRIRAATISPRPSARNWPTS